jgi:hypothetical protein
MIKPEKAAASRKECVISASDAKTKDKVKLSSPPSKKKDIGESRLKRTTI